LPVKPSTANQLILATGPETCCTEHPRSLNDNRRQPFIINACAALAAREALNPTKYEPPYLQPHEAEIKISQCGICHSDIHLIDNDWGFSSFRSCRITG
jgi:hypothetical protein